MATEKNLSTVSSSEEPSNTRSLRPGRDRIFQRDHLVWLLTSTDNEDDYKSVGKLREVVSTTNTFTDVDKCLDFIRNSKRDKLVIIVPGSMCETIVPLVHGMAQVRSIHIHAENKEKYEKYTEDWRKVHSVFTDVTQLCEILKQNALDRDYHSLSISSVTNDEIVNAELDTLDSSFMYSQILKEILLTINFEQKHIDEFLTFCREQPTCDFDEVHNLNKLCKEYSQSQSIGWYTFSSNISSAVNRALREMDVEFIYKLGFFVCDLHNSLLQLHSQEYVEQRKPVPSTVYRGQVLPEREFEKLKSNGGLISFNNFLSTSLKRDVSLGFAESNLNRPGLISVLFKITIDPSKCPPLFADIRSFSKYPEEEEILFSMHSVFRIGHVKKTEENNQIWEVELTLTSDNDPQLDALTKRMREETASDYIGWYRLGLLMVALGEFDKAGQLYEILLNEGPAPTEEAHSYYQLGSIKMHQGQYEEAIKLYENVLKIHDDVPSLDKEALPGCYNSIALAYDNLSESAKALLYYEKAEELARQILQADDPRFFSFHNNIGSIYGKMGEYSKALLCFSKAHQILERTLPVHHPNFATSYSNTAWVYDQIGEYAKALSYQEKAHEILQKTLPSNHLQLAISHTNLGCKHGSMGECQKALDHYKKSVEILEKTFPDHPQLATNYNNIGVAYNKMNKVSEALSYLEKALELRQKILPVNHLDLAASYNNVGGIYNSVGNQIKSLTYLNKALETRQTNLPANHPSLASTHNSIGNTYFAMNEYSNALWYYERALSMYQHSLPLNHPTIKNVQGSIAVVKTKI